MAEAHNELRKLEKIFRTRRIGKEDGPYLKCNYQEGTQELDMRHIPRERIPTTSTVIIALRLNNPEIVQQIHSINRKGYEGYKIRSRGKLPVLQNGEIQISGETITVKNATPILKKIKKQTGELHLSDIPMEIPLEETVDRFTNKFGIKVENSRLETVPGFSGIYNGIRILEIEKTKLREIKRAFYLHGFLTKAWYKGCIYHRKCDRCGETGHTPHKCPKKLAETISTYIEPTYTATLEIFPKQQEQKQQQQGKTQQQQKQQQSELERKQPGQNKPQQQQEKQKQDTEKPNQQNPKQQQREKQHHQLVQKQTQQQQQQQKAQKQQVAGKPKEEDVQEKQKKQIQSITKKGNLQQGKLEQLEQSKMIKSTGKSTPTTEPRQVLDQKLEEKKTSTEEEAK